MYFQQILENQGYHGTGIFMVTYSSVQNLIHSYSSINSFSVTLEVTYNQGGISCILKTIFVGIIPTNIRWLDSGWNIKSLPGFGSINKNELIIFYNDCYYNWDLAVENNIIVDYVFGWNRVGQNYEFADTFMPGHSYWMYTFQSCVLERDV